MRPLLVLLLLAPAVAQEADPDAHRTGRYAASYSERHPTATLKEVTRRFGWDPAMIRKEDPGAEARTLEGETFQVEVAAGYDRAKPAGVLVWISAGDSGVAPREWGAVAAKRNLLIVGADRCGNDRLVWDRARLAMDAVHNLSKRYAVDPKRIYVTGYSGGGRSASRLGICFPDVFSGGIYQCGMDYYKAIPNPERPKEAWPAIYPKPAGELLRKARLESRHVALNGEEDANLPPSRAMIAEMKKEGYLHADLVVMTGKGHDWADAEWLDKALQLLDEPAPPPKKK